LVSRETYDVGLVGRGALDERQRLKYGVVQMRDHAGAFFDADSCTSLTRQFANVLEPPGSKQYEDADD